MMSNLSQTDLCRFSYSAIVYYCVMIDCSMVLTLMDSYMRRIKNYCTNLSSSTSLFKYGHLLEWLGDLINVDLLLAHTALKAWWLGTYVSKNWARCSNESKDGGLCGSGFIHCACLVWCTRFVFNQEGAPSPHPKTERCVSWIHHKWVPRGTYGIICHLTWSSGGILVCWFSPLFSHVKVEMYLQMQLNHAIHFDAVSCAFLIGRVPVANGRTGCIMSHLLLVDL